MRIRDYKKEYARDHSSRKAKRHRAMRNYWNRKIATKPGQEIDHKIPLSKGGGNGKSNVRIVSRAYNRSKGVKTASMVYDLGRTYGANTYNTLKNDRRVRRTARRGRDAVRQKTYATYRRLRRQK